MKILRYVSISDEYFCFGFKRMERPGFAIRVDKTMGENRVSAADPQPKQNRLELFGIYSGTSFRIIPVSVPTHTFTPSGDASRALRATPR